METKSFNPVAWFEIYVNDMDRAVQFYETVLNIRLTLMSDPTDTSVQMQAFPGDPEGAGASGTLVKMEGVSAGGNNVVVYFGCEDCAVEEARVTAAGGKVVRSKISLGEYGFCSLITDTEGNTVGLYSMQ